MMISPSPYSVRPRRKSGRTAFITTLAAVVIVLGAVLYWRQPLSGALLKALSPVFAARQKLGQGQVQMLEAELASTTAALADRNSLAAENGTLKRLLGRTDSSKAILAGVLLRPPATPYDTLLIDAGSNDGIAVGALVYGGGSLVIGEVSEVFTTEARVTLLSAPGRDYDAEIIPMSAPDNVIQLPLQGQGGGSLMGQIPAGSAAQIGDSVVVPGITGAYVGAISHIDAPSGSSFETVYAQLPVDPFALWFVEVAVP